ncbi:MAG: DUF488 domain-containing protein [Thermoplasmataceae archaeon]
MTGLQDEVTATDKSERTLFTVGYSNRPFDQFLTLLKVNRIDILVDVRTIPKSRHRPEFNIDSLPAGLEAACISYLHMKGLGGLRKPLGNSVNSGWINESFRGFADYMQTDQFRNAIADLQDLAGKNRVAIMCAEGNPFSCHRSLIADAMLVRGYRVYEISGGTRLSIHKLTSFAEVSGENITYGGKNDTLQRA